MAFYFFLSICGLHIWKSSNTTLVTIKWHYPDTLDATYRTSSWLLRCSRLLGTSGMFFNLCCEHHVGLAGHYWCYVVYFFFGLTGHSWYYVVNVILDLVKHYRCYLVSVFFTLAPRFYPTLSRSSWHVQAAVAAYIVLSFFLCLARSSWCYVGRFVLEIASSLDTT